MLSELIDLKADVQQAVGIPRDESVDEPTDWSNYRIETNTDFSGLIKTWRSESKDAAAEYECLEIKENKFRFFQSIPKGVSAVDALAKEKERLSELTEQLNAAAHYLEWASETGASVGFILRDYQVDLKSEKRIKISRVLDKLSAQISVLKQALEEQAPWQQKSEYKGQKQFELDRLAEARSLLYLFNTAVYELERR